MLSHVSGQPKTLRIRSDAGAREKIATYVRNKFDLQVETIGSTKKFCLAELSRGAPKEI
jgi:hypothetical protein